MLIYYLSKILSRDLHILNFYSWIRGDLRGVICLHTRCGSKISSSTQTIQLQIFKTLFGKYCSNKFIENLKKSEFLSATCWSNYKPHNTVEFLVCAVPSLTMFWLLDVLLRHNNIMTNKGSYEVKYLPDVYICPFRNKNAPLLPEWIVKCTHSVAQQIHRECQLK